jgi:hypothetical protein
MSKQLFTYKAPTGAEIIGTLEVLSAVAMISGIAENGEVEYAGETNIDWSSQETIRPFGEVIYVDENHDEWIFGQLVKGDTVDAA